MDLTTEYPIVVDNPVAWGEMDAFQHVNNIVYFRYFENARIAYFRATRMLELMDQTGVGPILASTECRFLYPLTYPDHVEIGARIPEIGADRFTMEYAVASRQHDRLVALGKGVLVTYDYRSAAKVEVPAELKRRIEELEGRLQAT